MIVAVFAVDDDGGMGNHGTIPWPTNKEDMKWFKEVTTNQIVVMGKKSWLSPDMPKPLPNRHNVVITSEIIEDERITQIKGDVCEGLKFLQEKYPEQDIFVIGGANILDQARPVIERAFITRIPGSYFCDTVIDIKKFIKGYTLVNTNDLGTCKVEEYETV